MKVNSLAVLIIVIAGLSGCTPARNTPSLPPISSTPTSRPAAAIQNTEALDQDLRSDYSGPRY